MKTNKKIMMLIGSFAMFQGSIFCSQMQYAPTLQEQSSQSEDLIYSSNVESRPATAQDTPTNTPIILSDTTDSSYFSTAKTRTRTSLEVKNGLVITTTETWVTKNPSYITNVNMALMLAGLTAATAAGLSLYQYRNFLNVSPERYMGATNSEIVAAADLDFNYDGFIQQVKTASTYSGASKFIKKYCSTLGTGYGISESKLLKYEELAQDLIESNKLAIAQNPFNASQLIAENGMLQTFKDALRKVDSNFKREITDATQFASNVGMGTAVAAPAISGIYGLAKSRRR